MENEGPAEALVVVVDNEVDDEETDESSAMSEEDEGSSDKEVLEVDDGAITSGSFICDFLFFFGLFVSRWTVS